MLVSLATMAVFVGAMLLAAASVAASTHVTSTSKLNFVLIVTDDMGYNDFSAYGHPTIRTPNLDR